MICYLDKTFCISPNCTNACGRKLTPEIRAAAKKWWGSEDAPIAMAYFCDKEEKSDLGMISDAILRNKFPEGD